MGLKSQVVNCYLELKYIFEALSMIEVLMLPHEMFVFQVYGTREYATGTDSNSFTTEGLSIRDDPDARICLQLCQPQQTNDDTPLGSTKSE